MAKLPGMYLRNGIWWYRVRVPADVRAELGATEYKRSLRTGDLRDAKERRNLEAALFDKACRDARTRQAAMAGQLPPGPLPARFLQSLQEYVETSAARARDRMTETNLNPADRSACIEDAGTLASHYQDANDRLTQFDVSRLCLEVFPEEFERLTAEQKRELYELARRAALEVENRALAWLQGRFRAESFDHLFNITPPSAEPQRPSKSLRSLANEFYAEYAKTSRTSTKNLERIKSGLELVAEFFGPDATVADLTLEQCRDFRDALTRMPSNRTKKLAGATLEKAMQQVDAGRLKPFARNTQATKLGVLKMLLSEAHRRELIRRDFGGDLRPTEERSNPRLDRSPFSERDLRAIFSSDHYPPPPAKVSSDLDTARYWIPLICLYSGMRLNEAAQLDVDDIKISEERVPFFELSPGPSKRLKSNSARRLVPIHKRLLELGILDFVKRREVVGKEKLFSLTRSKHGYYSDGIQKWFSRTLMKNCGVSRDRKSFHSLRHTITDALRKVEAPEPIIKTLMGWSGEKSMLNVYGSGYSVQTLKKWIDRVDYRALT